MPMTLTTDVNPVVDSLRKFVRARIPENRLTFGIELETEFRPTRGVFNPQRWESELHSWLNADHLAATSRLNGIPRTMNTNTIRWLAGRPGIDIFELFGTTRQRVLDYWRPNFESDDSTGFHDGAQRDRPRADIEGMHRGTDGSVNGWEYRTTGGVMYANMITIAQRYCAMMAQNPSLYSSYKTSAHVHCKIVGVNKHIGNMRLYWLLVNELSKVWSSNSMPEHIKQRITGRDLPDPTWTRYYAVQPTRTEKYNVCRVHPEHGTWEFRLWGNVKTEADIQFCLLSTARVMQSAYRQLFGILDGSQPDQILAMIDLEKHTAYTGVSPEDLATQSNYTNAINRIMHEVGLKAQQLGVTMQEVYEEKKKGNLQPTALFRTVC